MPVRPLPAAARSPLLGLLLGALLAVFGLASAAVQADSYDDRRVRTGARLLRSLLEADLGLEQRLRDRGQVAIWVVASSDSRLTDLLALLAPAGDAAPVRLLGRRLHAEVIAQPWVSQQPAPAAVFLAQRLDAAAFEQLRDWSIRERVILYSPFEGDVERGATAGLAIEARVQPFVNMGTLEASGIELKPFFLRVAKAHR